MKMKFQFFEISTLFDVVTPSSSELLRKTPPVAVTPPELRSTPCSDVRVRAPTSALPPILLFSNSVALESPEAPLLLRPPAPSSTSPPDVRKPPRCRNVVSCFWWDELSTLLVPLSSPDGGAPAAPPAPPDAPAISLLSPGARQMKSHTVSSSSSVYIMVSRFTTR